MSVLFCGAGDPRLSLPAGDLWVFAYGSLLWRPGFATTEQHRARIFGYHRALCVWSHHHRGRPQAPGLVCGLDAGGSCLGLALRVPAKRKHATVRYLSAREMVTPAYVPRLVRARIAGAQVIALTFAVDRGNRQYAGRLDLARMLATVRAAAGASGDNRDYVLKTAETLRRLRVRDGLFEQLARALCAESTPPAARAAPTAI